MSRELKLLWAGVALGLLLSAYLQSLSALKGAHPIVFFAIGAAIAAPILLIPTLVNRANIAKPEKNGQYIEFKIRPWKAAEYTVVLSLTAVGLIAIVLSLQSKGLASHAAFLMVLPVVAVGPAVYFSSYFNPAPAP